MESNQPHELKWIERPLPELTRLAWPIAVSMLSYSMMSLADTLFVSWLGSTELAGVGLGGTLSFALVCFPFGLLASTKILVSQSVGAGRSQDAPTFIGPAVWLAITIGLIVAGVAWLVADLIPDFTATRAAGESAGSYVALRGLGAPFAMTAVALREGRQGLGDARSPMVAALIANIANVALDYVLIFPLGLGVQGAALASVVGQFIEAVLLLRVQRRDGLVMFGPLRRHFKALMELGLPTGIQYTLEMGSFTVLAIMISHISDEQMAAHQIVLQVIHLSFLPAHALSEAAAVLVGQLVGARREDRVRSMSHHALMIAVAYMGICGIIFLFAGRLIVSWFTVDPVVTETAVTLFRVAAAFQVFDAANMVGRNTLRGTGDVRVPAIVSVVTAWACTPSLMWLLGYRMGYGALGGWLGVTAELTIVAAVFWWRIERGSWKAAAEKLRQSREAAIGAVGEPEVTVASLDDAAEEPPRSRNRSGISISA